jgi:uncharacterized protein
MRLRVLAVLWLLLAPAFALAVDRVPLPALSDRVTDLTATLTPPQRATLEASVAAIEKEKGSQVTILILPTTQPEEIEQFSIRLAEAWKIGRGGVDDGVIVIVAKDDHKMRIEVGYGLEGVIPDVVAKRIVSDVMAPHFRDGDYAGGLGAAVDALGKLIRGEALPAPEAVPEPGQIRDPERGYWILAVILGGNVLRAMFGVVGSALAAGVAGALAWWIFGVWPLALIAAIVAFLFSFSGNFRGGGGGGLGGGGFSSSSSSGGGFSGGGGSFGGGGASGSW